MKNSRDPHRPTRLIALLALAALLSAARPPTAVAEEDEFASMLAKERWRESSLGISMRPPLGSTLMTRTFDDAVVRVMKANEYSINVYIKSTQQDMTIDTVVRTAIEQFGFAQPTSKILEQRVIKPAKRPGWLIYFGGNLPATVKPEDQKARQEALARIARSQLETANELRKKGHDLDAFRIYKAIAQHSPDAEVSKKAKEWVDAFEADRAFVGRFLRDEARRKKEVAFMTDNRPWVVGQAYMQVSPQNFVTLQIEIPFEKYEATKEIFEAMIKSIEIQNPEELDKLRKELIERGDTIRKTFSYKQMSATLLPEVRVPIVDDQGKPAGVAPLRLQYLRVVEGENDIGWMKIVHRARRDEIIRLETRIVVDPATGKKKIEKGSVEREAGVNGIGIDFYSRLVLGAKALDTHSQLFVSEDANYESWATRTSVRENKDFQPAPGAGPEVKLAPKAKPAPPPGPDKIPPKPAPQVTYLETGVRNHDYITIIREGPSGIERFAWRKPRSGYISQVELMLMAGLLPRKDAEYGFYAYYPQTGSISFRTARVVPEGDAGFRIYSRPTPDAGEQISEYDKDGNLTHRLLPEGREMIPTTREELAKRHKIDLPEDTAAAPPLPTDLKPLPPNRVPR